MNVTLAITATSIAATQQRRPVVLAAPMAATMPRFDLRQGAWYAPMDQLFIGCDLHPSNGVLSRNT